MPSHHHDTSVAPKERINIKYQPATGNHQGDIELPLALLVVGNLRGNQTMIPLEQRSCINIDKQNFNAVMKESALQLAFAIPNHLQGAEQSELPITLQFESLADFTPDRIAQQVPELYKLLQLREALVALKGPLGNIPAFRQRLCELLGDPETRAQLLQEVSLLNLEP